MKHRRCQPRYGTQATGPGNANLFAISLESRERVLRIYEPCDLAVKPVTARSRLYSLPPIGLGTALVESLSSYVVRLAEAHAVSAADLVRRELSRHTNPPLVFYSPA